jgi:pyruvate kinase
MVTASTEVSHDLPLVVDMLEKGMNILRINCAHDNAEVWAKMIANVRRAEQIAGTSCLILMDLAGPKLRTGPVEPGPSVVKVQPSRDPLGKVNAPARVWLAPEGVPAPVPVDAVLPLSAEWLEKRSVGEKLEFVDARSAKRRLKLIEGFEQGWVAETGKTAYVETGTELRSSEGSHKPGVVGALPARPGELLLQTGDTLILTRSLDPGRNAWTDDHGRRHPARIGCTLPDVFALVEPGERIWFDDGKIGGVARRIDADEIEIEITRARDGGAKLRSEKGINMPDSDLAIDPLTQKDLGDLPFVTANADMIGLSFVQYAKDIANLRAHVHELGGRHPGVVLKIETRRAFEQLPDLIFEAMGDAAAGIMIARGDLAVEVGFERLAEVQEEILWIAEAAHLPVIWATQVLETLAQSGLPSRSEITDAAMGERAECVMLNKGPHVVEAIDVLDGILGRMTEHQQKKRSLLRQLKSWSVNRPE